MSDLPATPRCPCCHRPVTALQLLCLDCWARAPATLRREFVRASARAWRHHGTQGWRALPEAEALVAAVTDKLRQRTEAAGAINRGLF